MGGEDAMLRVMVHENGSLCRLEIAGRLAGPWVAETEQSWRSSMCSGKQIEIDVRELTGIDDCGRELLAAMHAAGARLIVQGVWMKALVEEISGRPFDCVTRLAQKKRVPGDRRSGKRRNAK